MTDKDFDRLLKDALTDEDAPHSLNESLILLAKKQPYKKAKIFKFVKTASSCAAVFVCAVAVLSYFNSDLFSQKNTTAPKEEIIDSYENEITIIEDNQSEEIEITSSDNKGDTVKKDISSTEIITTHPRTPTLQRPYTEESAPVQEDAASQNISPVLSESSAQTEVAVASEKEQAARTQNNFSDSSLSSENSHIIAAELPSGENTNFAEAEYANEYPQNDLSDASMDTFTMRRSAPVQTLDMLFNEDYDYKTVISEKIAAQIALMDFPESISFSQISGSEQFSLSEENVLTIQFAAGTIASEAHGDLFFTVGTVQNGILIE